MWDTLNAGGEWYGIKYNNAEGSQLVGDGGKVRVVFPRTRYTPEERLEDMDKEGTDVQVVSVDPQIFGYHLDTTSGVALAKEINNEIASMVERWPARFAGLATLPMQHVSSAISELDRAVSQLGLKGAELDTVVNGRSWDEPEYLPLFKAAESMGQYCSNIRSLWTTSWRMADMVWRTASE